MVRSVSEESPAFDSEKSQGAKGISAIGGITLHQPLASPVAAGEIVDSTHSNIARIGTPGRDLPLPVNERLKN